jgi:hypothetical protein
VAVSFLGWEEDGMRHDHDNEWEIVLKWVQEEKT